MREPRWNSVGVNVVLVNKTIHAYRPVHLLEQKAIDNSPITDANLKGKTID
jgi:hypothetical protein